MSEEIVNLSDKRRERQATQEAQHITGKARCIACKHEWQAVAEVGAVWLECPECATGKGLFLGPCSPPEGGYMWRCNCGCDVFFIVPEAVKCCQCGAQQSGY